MDEDKKTTPSTNSDGIDHSPEAQEVNKTNDISSSGRPMKEIPIPDEAQDSDLIEKEWVDRAKEIVEHTKDDPHEQQRAFNVMKAEYMKKRYNKEIKIDES